jgi:YVTN family beta-propeller protein
VIAEIPVGARPHNVALDASGRTAYVSNQESDTISVIDLATNTVAATLPAGFGPAGIALVVGGSRLLLANSYGDDISLIDVASRAEEGRLVAGRIPVTAVASADGDHVLVANQLARPGRPEDPPIAEVTAVDARGGRIERRYPLPGAHLLGGIAFTPEGDLALVTIVRPKNLLPALQVERGWMMTNGFALLDLEGDRAVQLPLDDPGAYYADPADVAVTADGRLAFVSHGGADVVSVVDMRSVREVVDRTPEADLAGLGNRLALSRRYVVARIPVGSNPGRLLLAPGGGTLYVAERLDDRIGVIDVARRERVGSIDLGGPRHETIVRRGEKVFSSSKATLERQFSCRSCHPDGHMDQLQYDFEPDGLGRNIVDNKTMMGIADTGPFKWNGKNTSIYMQCGIRFARFLTRSQPLSFDDLNALVAYLRSIQPPRNRHRAADGKLTPAQERGRGIFRRSRTLDGTVIAERNRCQTCHPPPLYTNHRVEDVGSVSPTDSGGGFDTPQLVDLEMTAPYLHDGKALTLEEIWTVYNPDDTHGYTRDIGKSGLNDLIEYLKTL